MNMQGIHNPLSAEQKKNAGEGQYSKKERIQQKEQRIVDKE